MTHRCKSVMLYPYLSTIPPEPRRQYPFDSRTEHGVRVGARWRCPVNDVGASKCRMNKGMVKCPVDSAFFPPPPTRRDIPYTASLWPSVCTRDLSLRRIMERGWPTDSPYCTCGTLGSRRRSLRMTGWRIFRTRICQNFLLGIEYERTLARPLRS